MRWREHRLHKPALPIVGVGLCVFPGIVSPTAVGVRGPGMVRAVADCAVAAPDFSLDSPLCINRYFALSSAGQSVDDENEPKTLNWAYPAQSHHDQPRWFALEEREESVALCSAHCRWRH